MDLTYCHPSLYFASNFIIIRVCLLPSSSGDKMRRGGAMASPFYLDKYDSADDVYGLRGDARLQKAGVSPSPSSSK
jgi:hypothetical protein